MRIHNKPEVFLISRPTIDWREMNRYLNKVGERTEIDVNQWADQATKDLSNYKPGEVLVELSGRFCYRSWAPGANKNVTKIRSDRTEYLGNILESGHGSVLEHANFTFIFDDVSRVFTHELVRHRAGVAISQESLRFVRLSDIPFWFPEWAEDDESLMVRCIQLIEEMEKHQIWMAKHFRLDDPDVPFSEKKAKTSFMRRFAPIGVSTGIICTINVRALRHIIYMRTALAAEEEMRIVMDQVAEQVLREVPNLMQDYSPNEHREWIPSFLKV